MSDKASGILTFVLFTPEITLRIISTKKEAAASSEMSLGEFEVLWTNSNSRPHLLDHRLSRFVFALLSHVYDNGE